MKPQFPLVFSTLCQRVSMGAYALGMIALYLFDMDIAFGWLTLAALAVLAVGMLGSMAHLGRPARFLNTFANMKSHLAQEGLLVFIVGVLFVAVGIDGWLITYPPIAALTLRILALLAALAFIITTAQAYHMPSRPAWKSYATPITFLLTWLSIGAISVLAWAAVSGVDVNVGFCWLTAALMVAAVLGQAYYLSYVGNVGYKIDVRPLADEYRMVFVSWVVLGVVVPILIMAAILAMGNNVVLTVTLFVLSSIALCIWQAFFFLCGKEIWYFPDYDNNMSPNYF
jgi:anaerobic dimethyl sulfoxide reductase subunit C (anchor subunit)